MLMYDLRPDRRMHRAGDTELGQPEQRDVPTREFFARAQVFASASPRHCCVLAPRASAAFISRPVSSAMPNVLAEPAATSSLVPPYAASSKSWMAALPFIATGGEARCRIRAISSGPRPP